MRRFAGKNKNLDACMRTHLIRLDTFGAFENDYDKFFSKRCQAFSRELKKRIIEQEVDTRKSAVPAGDTVREETE
jgi:hypothetical protein